MPIQFRCPGCSQPIEVDPQHAGKAAQCPYCQRVVTVPAESTLDTLAPVTARPAGGENSAGMAPPPLPGSTSTETSAYSPPPLWTPPVISAAEIGARSFGNYALIFAGLAVAMAIAAIIGWMIVLGPTVAQFAATQPTPDQMQAVQAKLMQHPWIGSVGCGSCFFAALAVVLGLVSWRQHPASNWRAWISVGVGGVFMLCICGSIAISALLPVGM